MCVCVLQAPRLAAQHAFVATLGNICTKLLRHSSKELRSKTHFLLMSLPPHYFVHIVAAVCIRLMPVCVRVVRVHVFEGGRGRTREETESLLSLAALVLCVHNGGCTCYSAMDLKVRTEMILIGCPPAFYTPSTPSLFSPLPLPPTPFPPLFHPPPPPPSHGHSCPAVCRDISV